MYSLQIWYRIISSGLRFVSGIFTKFNCWRFKIFRAINKLIPGLLNFNTPWMVFVASNIVYFSYVKGTFHILYIWESSPFSSEKWFTAPLHHKIGRSSHRGREKFKYQPSRPLAVFASTFQTFFQPFTACSEIPYKYHDKK